MSHIDYLSRNPINEVKKLEEIVFVGNVAYKIIKFSLIFIYNHYRPLISIRTKDHIKGFYQSSYEKWKLNDKTVLNLVLREFKKKTDLVVALKRAK